MIPDAPTYRCINPSEWTCQALPVALPCVIECAPCYREVAMPGDYVCLFPEGEVRVGRRAVFEQNWRRIE